MIGRLHPHLRHAIVNELGWRELRAVQEQAIEAVLDGANVVVLAPTAGGKTEAAVFPVLSRILSEELRPVAALYVCPIRALLNNQEPRLRACARMVGLEAFKWHGDVAATRKERFRRDPAHLLLTTPESLEVMLISQRTDARALFARLEVVVVDEVHAFAADDRGAHLAALLERLTRFCGRDLQRIGLSATVGNPDEVGRWLQGSSGRTMQVIDPPRPASKPDLRLDLCADLDDLALGVARLARGRKSLVFVESRAQAEKTAQALAGRGVDVFVHHSSVSRADRQRAEERFSGGRNAAIVCTATMELGIDVGDLDQVVQIDAPAKVSSFLQRLGRSGRRPGASPRCTLFCLSPEALLQGVAVLRLAERGWVEDVQPARRALHVLAHQILALSLQEGGVSRHRMLRWVAAAAPFAGLGDEDAQALVDTMRDREILHEAEGLLSLGRRGEELYGRRHFFQLYAVFDSPPMLRVLHGRHEVGHVQARFVLGHPTDREPLCFRLAGRSWEVTQVEWSRGRLLVRPAEAGRVPSWLGLPSMLSRDLCQEMRRCLLTAGPEGAWLGSSAAAEMAALREAYADVLPADDAPLEVQDDQVQWHTFAGGASNRVLAAGLEQTTGAPWVAGNLSLRAKDVDAATAAEGIRKLAGLDLRRLARTAARRLARGPVSKFQPCLPRDAEDRLLADALLDVEGAEVLANREGVVQVHGGTRRPAVGPPGPSGEARAGRPG